MPSPASQPELIAVEDVMHDGRRVTIVRLLLKRIMDSTGVIQPLKSLLDGLVEEHGRTNLVINLGVVEIIATEFLGVLLTLDKRIKTVQGKLSLCQLAPTINPNVYEAFKVTGLLKHFVVCLSERDAVNAI